MLNNRQQGRRRGRGRGSQGSNGGRQDNGSRIDNRARGNAPQMLEKYKNLAREAQLQGDRVLTEYYLQFADHYFRIVAESRARMEETRQPRRDDWQAEDGDEGDSYDQADVESAADESDAGDDNSQSQQRERRPTREKREFRPRRDGNRQAESGNEPAEEAATIDVAILPPALGVSADPAIDLDAEPAPRRRGRPRRAAQSEAEAEAAE